MLETNVMLRKSALGNDKLITVSDDDILSIQKVIYEILADFDTVCREAGIEYLLCGGSALGAVREKGFIPWDDDADICIPRKDYDRFFELFTNRFSNKYFIQKLSLDSGYDLTFTKIRKKGTKLVEIYDPEPEKSGIFIDVYAVENVPDNPVLRFFHGHVSDFLYLCCSCVRMKGKKEVFDKYITDPKAKKLIKFKIMLGKLLGFFTIQKWCTLALNWSSKCKNSNSKYVTFPDGRNHYFGEMCRRSSFFPAKEAEFSGLRLFVMSDPSEYLTKLYGDYMSAPPVNMREHHSIIELDFGEIND